MKGRLWAAAGLVAALATLTAACGSNSSKTNTPAPGGAAASSRVMLASTGIGTVLVDSGGKTIYWFAIDTPTTSNCTGACATFWPPVKGPVTAAAGTTLPHTFGTI